VSHGVTFQAWSNIRRQDQESTLEVGGAPEGCSTWIGCSLVVNIRPGACVSKTMTLVLTSWCHFNLDPSLNVWCPKYWLIPIYIAQTSYSPL